ncbi:MAG: serine/threonine protein phosphatase [Promethearchaeota archaeon]|nr:MAG: serine/threonine protein phosphatase [Candidatus Lokiarchaeota archaeon]
MVVGDLHGDLETLQKIIQAFFREKFKNLLFLGDYVDRGAKQVEVINVLFYYKKLMPERIILIRGNHEDPIINRQYGFYDELRLKFNNSKEMFRLYNQAFSKLPIAAITWNRIFCVHAGIAEGLKYVEDINLLPKNQEEIDCPITTQLVWNDPKERLKDFKNSSRGPGIRRFGKDVLDDFIERNKLNLIIRAHERFKNGYKTYFNEKLLSIFTSHSYSKRVETVVGVINADGEVDVISI